ncbi:MAG: GH39 family glycosyl hydrolase [Isosphaeraceae bacterium]
MDRRSFLHLGIAGAVLALGGGWASAQSEPTVIRVDASAPSRPFPHFWEQVFGSGRANITLRESWRKDLRAVKGVTDLRYVRFHGIFGDENGVYREDKEGNPIYNWSYVDQIYDGVLDQGARPFIELSFMPSALASSQKPHPFWYRPLPNPPKSYEKWGNLVGAFTRHLVERYGAEEVRQWYFEVWNEPNIDFWTGKPAQSTYFELYDAAARAVKSVDGRLRVGGPATAQAAWTGDFIRHCVAKDVPVDFVSTHVYGNDSSRDVLHNDEKVPPWQMVARAVRKVHDEVKASPRPELPIIWSEYNATYMNQPEITDSAFLGSWLANNIRQCDGLTTIMAYWCFSDVFEEQGVVKKPFYGGYGIIAAGSIPKAAFNAFALLHRLGDQRISPELKDALVTRRGDGKLVVAVWNYAEPNASGPPRDFELRFSAGTLAEVTILDDQHGSAITEWRKLGQPDFPSREQQRALRDAGKLPASRRMPIDNGVLRLSLSPHALALIEVTP